MATHDHEYRPTLAKGYYKCRLCKSLVNQVQYDAYQQRLVVEARYRAIQGHDEFLGAVDDTNSELALVMRDNLEHEP